MKLAFSTLGCPGWKWDRILEEASRLGYDGIEIRGIEGEYFLPKARPFLPDNMKETLARLEERKLEIVVLDTSCIFHDEKCYEDAIMEGKATIDLACAIGSPYIRVLGDVVPEPSCREETLGRIIKGVGELSGYCEGKNVAVLLETHGDFSDLDNLLPILKNVKSSNFGLIWDVEHTYALYGDGESRFLDRAVKYIRHVHIKDTRKTDAGFQLCLIGEGDIPIDKDVDFLEKCGYNGYFSLEWEKRWHPELAEPEIAFPGYIAHMRRIAEKGGDKT